MLSNSIKSKAQKVASRAFTTQNSLTGSINPDRNHNLRVMSTPTWPVPYYQRVHRHDPNPRYADPSMNLDNWKVEISDHHSVLAKEILKASGKGHIVEAVENHFEIDNYQTSFACSSQFAEAYVDDMIDCLDLVAKQDQKLLNEFSLDDCLN